MSNFLISGEPKSGKSTLVSKLVDKLGEKYELGGMISLDYSENDERKGFKLKDIRTGEEGILASVDVEEGPKVSKYKVNLGDLKNVGVSAIREAIQNCDIIVVDEIGKMELYSVDFREVVGDALSSDKDVIATLHRAYLDEYKDEGKFFWLTREDFDQVMESILAEF